MEAFYDIMMLAVTLMLLVTLAAILRSAFSRRSGEVGGWEIAGAWRRIRAVARVTLAEGLRMKIAIVFIVLLIISLPLLCLTAKGDGTIQGRVQMFLGYSLGLTAFYLALLTIFFSSRTLAAEIATHQIYGLATKPIPRWQILAGKWAGIVVLNLLLVLFATAATYIGTRWLLYRFHAGLSNQLILRGGLTAPQAQACIDAIEAIRGPGGKGVSSPIIPAMAGALGWSNDRVIELLQTLPEETRVDLRRLDELRRQVLVARASVKPQPPDLSTAIERTIDELRKQGRLPNSPEWTPARIREQVRLQLLTEFTTVPPMTARQWVLMGPPPPKDDPKFLLSVRYKLSTSIYTTTQVLDDGRTLPENTFLALWVVGDPTGPNYYYWPPEPTPEVTRTFHEFEVPTHSVEPDGKIVLTLENRDPRQVDVVVPVEDGVEVLYRVGSFERNLIAGALTMLIPLMFLAAFGLMMSTFCTFPVAALVSLVFYAIACSQSFIAESLSLTDELRPVVLSTRDEIRKAATDAMFSVISLGRLSVTDRIINGRVIRWDEIGELAGGVVGWRGLLAMGSAVLVFRRRELAAVIV